MLVKYYFILILELKKGNLGKKLTKIWDQKFNISDIFRVLNATLYGEDKQRGDPGLPTVFESGDRCPYSGSGLQNPGFRQEIFLKFKTKFL